MQPPPARVEKEIVVSPTLRCRPELLAKDLRGAVYLVTGANSGIGLATTAQLLRQGARVILACRRMRAGADAARELGGLRGSAYAMELDLGNLASVRRFAAAFLEREPRLDSLVNNAGIMMVPYRRTPDGFESQIGVNHLGHFLLTELLRDRLRRSAPSRVVVLSSVAHAGVRGARAEIDLDDLHYERRRYTPPGAYAQSKLANVLHARELARRLAGTGVSAFSVHPGWARSNLIRPTVPPWVQNVLLRPLSGPLGMMSSEDAAHTTLHCLLDDDAPRHTGAYFSQKSLLYRDRASRRGGWPLPSPNPLAHDDALAERLFEVSLRLVAG